MTLMAVDVMATGPAMRATYEPVLVAGEATGLLDLHSGLEAGQIPVRATANG